MCLNALKKCVVSKKELSTDEQKAPCKKVNRKFDNFAPRGKMKTCLSERYGPELHFDVGFHWIKNTWCSVYSDRSKTYALGRLDQ
jgi:hypothetical protein